LCKPRTLKRTGCRTRGNFQKKNAVRCVRFPKSTCSAYWLWWWNSRLRRKCVRYRIGKRKRASKVKISSITVGVKVWCVRMAATPCIVFMGISNVSLSTTDNWRLSFGIPYDIGVRSGFGSIPNRRNRFRTRKRWTYPPPPMQVVDRRSNRFSRVPDSKFQKPRTETGADRSRGRRTCRRTAQTFRCHRMPATNFRRSDLPFSRETELLRWQIYNR